MATVEQNQFALIQDANEAVRDALKLNPFETVLLLHQLASLIHHIFKVPGLHVGCGHQLVEVWSKNCMFVLQK